jgi:hypothetical protein
LVADFVERFVNVLSHSACYTLEGFHDECAESVYSVISSILSSQGLINCGPEFLVELAKAVRMFGTENLLFACVIDTYFGGVYAGYIHLEAYFQMPLFPQPIGGYLCHGALSDIQTVGCESYGFCGLYLSSVKGGVSAFDSEVVVEYAELLRSEGHEGVLMFLTDMPTDIAERLFLAVIAADRFVNNWRQGLTDAAIEIARAEPRLAHRKELAAVIAS